MYVILRGKVRVSRPADPGWENLLTLLGPGDLFGELTLFDPAPRKATATAITDISLAEFTASTMKAWLAAEPAPGAGGGAPPGPAARAGRYPGDWCGVRGWSRLAGAVVGRGYLT
jgi:Cyclic nucleotide-binding domain